MLECGSESGITLLSPVECPVAVKVRLAQDLISVSDLFKVLSANFSEPPIPWGFFVPVAPPHLLYQG
jgi:hypothetical protein